MRIMILGAAVSNHTIRWANSLAERNHEVYLVCRGDQRARKENTNIHNSVKIYYLRYGGGMGYYLNVPEFKRLFKSIQPDVVNAHYATGYAALARLAKAKPLIISFWGSDIFDFPFRNSYNKRLLWHNIQYADGIASTSLAMANKIREVYPSLQKEICVTPFGVNTDLFKPVFRSDNPRPIIGIVKYLEPIYDIPLLLNAFAIIKNKFNPHPLLHIYGGGSLLGDLKKLCDELNITEDVTFFGTIPNAEIARAINSMDVFVNCSKTESFGVALVEAMACAVPVVATDTEGFREVVEDGVTGVILKDRKPETMANEIIKLLNDKEKSKEYGNNGRKRVLELYDWNNNVIVMEELYRKVSDCRL